MKMQFRLLQARVTHAVKIRLLCVSTSVLCALSMPVLATESVSQAPTAKTSATSNSHKTLAEIAKWEAISKRVTITRDKWGIPHVDAATDADAVFGLLYAQAEDDFPRIELNYVNALGRLAEIEGEKEIWRDLRMKMYIDPTDLKAKYAKSPLWLKRLMQGFADGLNFYLHTHPHVKPRLIQRFEPWMALAFSEGSIGGDIESINLKELKAFYQTTPVIDGGSASVLVEPAVSTGVLQEPRGSNGFAIAPARTVDGHAMLLINPHTSFYFRPEVHVRSAQGLNAYGAVTWGQFFIYQGFNEYNGWMHTSDGADVIDEYLLSVHQQGDQFYYEYEGKKLAFKVVEIVVPYKTDSGIENRTIRSYFSHHGPVIRRQGKQWVAVKMMQEPVKALMQSYLRTKTRNIDEFAKVMQLKANSSNNTVYADKHGTIAYYHGNFVPRRAPEFDWTRPVDGSTKATEWQGLHELSEIIQLRNPHSGWIQNTNNWPFSAAGGTSPRRDNFPKYMWSKPENARGLHAVKVLSNATRLNLDGLIALAYDPELTAFESLLPPLFAAYESDPRPQLQTQVTTLRQWDFNARVDSVATSLAIYWAQELVRQYASEANAKAIPVIDYLKSVPSQSLLNALSQATERLRSDFGDWQIPWGEINRFQRLSGAIGAGFDDSKPSFPVAFASGNWGSLASFGMTAPQVTKRIYGDRGNSFVAVVSFGPKVVAKSILAGGQSADTASPHFSDQAEMYAKGQFKDVLFYPKDIMQHMERRYHPGH